MHKLWCNEPRELGRSLEIKLDTWGESNDVKLCQLWFLPAHEGVEGAEQDDYCGRDDDDSMVVVMMMMMMMMMIENNDD